MQIFRDKLTLLKKRENSLKSTTYLLKVQKVKFTIVSLMPKDKSKNSDKSIENFLNIRRNKTRNVMYTSLC